jgi:penicillin-binding protein 2
VFERRLKIFLLLVVAVGVLIVGRSAQVQIVQASQWRELAEKTLRRAQLAETTRGRILDYKGTVLAEDIPCNDVCVDFRAIPPEPDADWVRKYAIRRLKNTDEYKSASADQRKVLLAAGVEQVKADIKAMWATLARVSTLPPEEIDSIRSAIRDRVEMRRRGLQYRRWKQAVDEHNNRDEAPLLERILAGGDRPAPELDDIEATVSEQTEAHVILRNVDDATFVELSRQLDKFPGLVLRPSKTRHYPKGAVACHVIGHMARVDGKDLEEDPDAANDLRQYLPNDLVGRVGLEAIAERRLRGSRGRIERSITTGDVLDRIEPKPGEDIRTTIDIELQERIEAAFNKVSFKPYKDAPREELKMPGAAVVIELATGEIRALVSQPGFDLNDYDHMYPALLADVYNRPMMNRATQFALEPGSTMKVVVGLGAITQGVIGPQDTIECTGYLVLDGRKYTKFGRCWTMKMFNTTHMSGSAPHPTGHLTYPDALERSCNVFFETLADRLGIEGLEHWYRAFGLGQPVGIGLPEVAGRTPGSLRTVNGMRVPTASLRGEICFAGIGQGPVNATPLQAANIAATVARGGMWVRPTLIPRGEPQPKPPEGDTRGDRQDLHLNPDAVAEAREGMFRVVNGPAGTGKSVRRQTDDILIAGKTGSAQAAPLRVPRRNPDGTLVKEKDRVVYEEVQLGTRAAHNPQVEWYRGGGSAEDQRTHGWYVGFFPADNPKYAFAAFVEYGGSGGESAGSVASAIVQACIDLDYVPGKKTEQLEAERKQQAQN